MMAALRVYTICYNPSDFPGKFTVRGFTVIPGLREPRADRQLTGVADSLEAARELVPLGADTLIPRSLSDEPQIVESWI